MQGATDQLVSVYTQWTGYGACLNSHWFDSYAKTLHDTEMSYHINLIWFGSFIPPFTSSYSI